MPVYYFSADDEFKKANKGSYVAIAFDSEDAQSDDLYYVKASEKQSRNMIREINYTKTPFELLPVLSMDDTQRDVMVVFGASGSGKSYFSNQISGIWKEHNPRKKIYFITNNNYKKDTSLTHSLYDFINLNGLLDRYGQEGEIDDFKINSDFDNSLMVFDDIDLEENLDKKKLFFTFLGVILKFKRKNNISVLYTTHHVSDYKYTRELLIEMTCYVTFSGDLKNRSNRVLTDYLKLRTDEVDRIANNQNSRWTCIKTRYRTVITQKEVYFLQ